MPEFVVPDSPALESITHRIAASTVGPHSFLTLPHLIRLFQEAALINTDHLGISSRELTQELGLTWVLHRQVIDAERWPRIGERVRVLTLPTRVERQLITYRDFYLLDGNDRPMVRSTSAWSVMSLDSRRIRPIPERVTNRITGWPDPEQQLSSPGEKPEPPTESADERTFRVGFSHLDFNNHLTNPAFPELMLEPLGLDFLSGHLPLHADIAYQREARYGEMLVARTSATAPATEFAHALYRNEGELLASMRSQWTPLK